MALLDRFRRQNRWEHEDAAVRLEGVREVPSDDQATLAGLARHDSDGHVRRAALKRVVALEVVLEAAGSDEDAGVRDEARARLIEHAQGPHEGPARTALSGLADPRSLALLAKAATLAPLRLAAVERLTDERALASVARGAEDAAVRRLAASRVSEAGLLREIALKSEHRDVAVGAVERLFDLDALRELARKAKNGGAQRRAAARVAELEPKPEPEPVAPVEAAPEPQPEPEVELAPEAAPEPSAPEVVEAIEAAPLAPVAAEAAPVESPVPDAAPAEASAEREAPGPEAAERRAALEKERRERVARVEGLVSRLETLAGRDTLALKEADAALREARGSQAELSLVAPKLAQRAKAARAALFAKSQPLREAEDWTRWSNAGIQEQLCEKLEGLASRSDFEKMARELRECDERWAAARQVPRDEAEALRERYQAARARVKAPLDAYFAKKSETEGENLKRKEALCVAAEALADSSDWIKAADELKRLQGEWKPIGPAPRQKAEAVWKRFRSACDRFFTRRQADLKQRKEGWSANLVAKTALIEKASALANSTDWDAAVAEARKLQAEWKATGAVRRNKSDELWTRFRAACDAVFERYKHRDEIAAEARRAEREALCAEFEALGPAEAGSAVEAPEEVASKVLALYARSRQASGLASAEEAKFAARLLEARNRIVGAWPAAFAGTDLDPEVNRARREKLLARVEALAARFRVAAPPDPGALHGADLARRLKEALASNTMGGKAEAGAQKRADAEEVEAARESWKRLGPVPGDEGASLEARFAAACAPFAAPARPRGGSSRPGVGAS